MVLTGQGAVLSFGHGEHGQLGHGDEAEQWLPKAIEPLQYKAMRTWSMVQPSSCPSAAVLRQTDEQRRAPCPHTLHAGPPDAHDARGD